MFFANKRDKVSLNLDNLESNLILNSIQGKEFFAEKEHFKAGDEEEAQKEYEKIENFIKTAKKNKNSIEEIKMYMSHFEDIRFSIKRAGSGETLELHEFYEIKHFAFFYQKIFAVLKKLNIAEILCYSMENLFAKLDPDKKNIPSFKISANYSPELKATQEELADLSRKRKNGMRLHFSRVEQETGLKNIGGKISVSRFQQDMIRQLTESDYFVRESENFANQTFSVKIPEHILAYDSKITEKTEEIKKTEEKVRRELSSYIKSYRNDILRAYEKIGELDWLVCRFDFSEKYDCIIPKINKGKKIYLREAVNIPVSEHLEKSDINYQKQDLEIEKKVNIITGANMGGKTTILKTIGQIALLASYAVPIPAKKAELPLFDFIFYSGYAVDTGKMDLSSFGEEVVQINKALEISGRGLYLIDELGRGTNPAEGDAFCRAVFEEFLSKEALMIAATHFSRPSEISEAGHFRIAGLKNLPENFELSSQTESLQTGLKRLHEYMDYSLLKIEPNSEPPHDALRVAELLGVNKNIILKAKKILKK
ncbi:MAG: hypothetical protein CSB55_02270 [Candidatus Cloacimonadota bacterium]|nr:MAG: hypothetical protein CSB55_02270 [Candidatus Cloacimonadota bacterium]